jgi:Tfp pilus assembly protein PilZ
VAFKVDGKSGIALSEDVSMHGVFVATDEGVTEGAPVELSIIFTDETQTVKATGRIAWVNKQTALKKPNFPTGFGVELLEFKEMTGRILESFLNSYTSINCPQGNQ